MADKRFKSQYSGEEIDLGISRGLTTPVSPEEDGMYVLKRENGENEYLPLNDLDMDWEEFDEILEIIEGPIPYVEFKAQQSFQILSPNTKSWNGTLQYYTPQTDEWIIWDGQTNITAEPQNEYFYIRLRGLNNGSIETTLNFSAGISILCSGNIEALLDYSKVLLGIHPTMFPRCFKELFKNAPIITAPRLPATTLANYCYQGMFQNSSLIKPPRLPATTLGYSCYQSMFQGCVNLLAAPSLPATTLESSCYRDMFHSCILLTEAPDLPATTLKSYCYRGMFDGCSSLVKAPDLPATTLLTYCYAEMFQYCGSLIEAPKILATTLATYCCQNMFNHCSSLKVSPELSATTLADDCYVYMFLDCSSLEIAPELPATTLTEYCYSGMFQGCTSLVTPPILPATTLPSRCYLQMFKGCSSLTTVPALPATILQTNGCYSEMFRDCISLTQLPQIITTELPNNCCSAMFRGCTNIKLSTTQSEEYPNEYRIPAEGTITTVGSIALTDIFRDTGGTFTSEPSVNTTYYTSNEIVPAN